MLARAEAIFRSDLSKIELRTDKMFFWLLIGQWAGAVLVALVWSPRTWIAQYWSIHQHVLAALFLGGLFAVYPLYLIIRQPGRRYTRHIIAVGQMLQSALLVHVTGGRIETHFHVFGSLALLAFYRDWPVLITGGTVVYLDHLGLGAFFPLSIYGVTSASIWRSVEHAFWVVFEVVFLTMSCRKGIEELRTIAERQVMAEELADELQQSNATLEARIRQRTRELEDANRNLSQYAKKVEEVNKELDDFTYIVSHDLKEPLCSIDAFSKFVIEYCGQNLNTDAQGYLSRVRANARRMQQLIEGLLQVSRLSRKAHELERVDIQDVINEVKLRFEYVLAQRHVAVAVNGKMPVLSCDRIRIAKVFANLISNAIKYNDKPECRIEIACRSKDGEHEFTVADNGRGIEPQYFEKIFQIFQRLGKKEEQEGAGVGLTIVKKIIELHQGKVWVESKVGQGSRFHFTLVDASSNGKPTNGFAAKPADSMQAAAG